MTIQTCVAPGGYVANSADCDDSSAAIKPGATETCNGVDDNCNGTVDEGVKLTFYRDADGDTYGAAGVTTQACSAPSGYVTNSTDCDDTSAAVKPTGTETCNGVDDNCNGTTDEGVKLTFYRDADGDTYGAAGVTTQACSAPSGYVANSTDCNDASASIKPGATEINCNSIDEDCSGADLCPCTASLLQGLNTSTGVSIPGQWWIDTFLKTEGTKALVFEYDPVYCGYRYTSPTETSTFSITIPQGALFVQADVNFRNYADYGNGVDTTSYLTLTLGSTTKQLGPYTSVQTTTLNPKWSITPAQWGTTVTFTAVMNVSTSTYDCGAGIAIDNVRVVCQ